LNHWEKLRKTEISRLEKTLSNHLREMGTKKTLQERHEFVIMKLSLQKFTCAFADGDGRFCWNHPRNKNLRYLKLEWGHKIPRYHGKMDHVEDNLILLCARCNNQIQTSRTVKQLIPELEHKLKALKKLM